MNSMSTTRFGIYLHSPFCGHKCGYCDFNSWAETRIEPQKKWMHGVQKSTSFWAQHLYDSASNSPVECTSFFWGGGTPSLVDNLITENVLKSVFESWRFKSDSEKTIEVNPETLTLEKLQLWSDLGINRLSMGIQSFSEKNLDLLERHARPMDNIKALEWVSKNWNGKSWSLDLIFGLPGQTLEDWRADLETAMVFSPPHVSAYQLTLSTERSKNWRQPPENELEQLFDFTCNFLESKGYNRYEVSNFAKPLHESRHNRNYWEMGSFAGIGPGAAGLLGPEIKLNNLTPPLLNSLTQSENLQSSDFFGFHQKGPDNFEKWLGTAGTESLELKTLSVRTRKDELYERLMMGLRLKKGIPFWSLPVSQNILAEMIQKEWAKDYFVQDSADSLQLNLRGLKILDTLLPKMFSYLEL